MNSAGSTGYSERLAPPTTTNVDHLVLAQAASALATRAGLEGVSPLNLSGGFDAVAGFFPSVGAEGGGARAVSVLGPGEAQPTRLEDRKKRNPPKSRVVSSRERRRHAYALLDGLRRVSSDRVRGCGRKRIAVDVDVNRRTVDVDVAPDVPASKKVCAYFAGVHRCKSVWECPVCSMKIRVERAKPVARAVEFYGFEQTAMLTLTVRHGLGNDLKKVRQGVANAYRRFTRGNPWKRFKEKYAVEHSIRALEITHGPNGWHPHIHALLFLVGSIEQVCEAKKWLQERWENCVRAELGDAFVPNSRGVDLRQYQHAEYIAKIAAWEIVDPGSKKGRRGNRSPAQIAADFVEHGSPRDAVLWRDYCVGIRGAKMLEWSRGLAEIVGLDDEDSTAEGAEVEDETVATIRGEAWDRVRDRRSGFRCEILEIAEGLRDPRACYLAIQSLLQNGESRSGDGSGPLSAPPPDSAKHAVSVPNELARQEDW